LEDFKLHINSNVSSLEEKGQRNWLKQLFFSFKLNRGNFFLLFSIAAVVISFLISQGGVSLGYLLIALVIGVPLIYFMIVYPRFGIMSYLNYAYFMIFLMALGVNAPLGSIMDFFLFLFIVSFFIHMKKYNEWKELKSPIGTIILVWISYNALQFFNPAASSRLAWLGAIRAVALVSMYFFVFLLHVRTRQFVFIIIKWWLFVSLINAGYAFKQEYFGFFDFEQRYLRL
jgi:putative inorganic carbon (hco3(-)) transporter